MGCRKLSYYEPEGALEVNPIFLGSALEKNAPSEKNRVNAYRYGFQGQEKDAEIYGLGNFVDYKFRGYNPRLGRFFAVDPLASKYPHWTPYQFAGNMVIQYIELEGLEPAKNPTDNSDGERAAKADVLTIGASSTNNNNVDNYPNPNTSLCGSYSDGCVGGIGGTSENGVTYVSDTQQGSADMFNMYVRQEGTFLVDESNAGEFNNYESFVVNELMQGFITGTGPENYVFPKNGIISNKFLDSDILSDALNAFETNGGQTTQYSFGGAELFRNLFRNEDAFNIDGFVGSGTITIIPNGNQIEITIFNVTSLSSGAYISKMPASPFETPKSYVREEGNTTPFGNISQTFQLSLPYKQ